MTDNITKDSEILKYAIAAGIIDLGSIRTQYEECERMNLLDSYEYKIFESGGRWYCRLPDGRRLKKKNREDVESEIIKIQKERKKTEKETERKKQKREKIRRKKAGGYRQRMGYVQTQ